MQGTVIFFNYDKGFGFIKQDENPDNIFFHISECETVPMSQDRVQYAIKEGRKGLEAANISII